MNTIDCRIVRALTRNEEERFCALTKEYEQAIRVWAHKFDYAHISGIEEMAFYAFYEAFLKFDPERGVKFSTFAKESVRNYLRKIARHQDSVYSHECE